MSRARIDLDALTPESLAALDDREMRDVVTSDLLRTASNQAIRTQVPAWITEALHGPLVERWVTALRQMLESVDAQLELLANEHNEALAQGANRDAETTRFRQARTKPLRFRAAVLEALPEAERLHAGRVGQLEAAIRTHREATLAAKATVDEALWSVLDD